MLQKINLKILGFSFIVLLLIVIIIQVANNKPERNFRTHLVEIDTTNIQRIEIVNFKNSPLELIKNSDGKWIVQQLEKNATVDYNALKSLILSLSDLKIERRVGANQDQWRKYEVNDSLATRLHVHSAKEELADIMVGKFSYKQRGQGMDITTYARMYDEDETYIVNGQLSMMTRRDFNGFRSHVISNVREKDLAKIEFKYPADSSFVLQKEGNRWLIDGNFTDSIATTEYLNQLQNVEAFNFTDSYDAKGKDVYKIYVEKLSGQFYEIEAYREGESYIMRTTLNENAIFAESNRTFGRIFKSASYFVNGS